MALAPDGRIFVCQQGGELRVIKNSALLPTPFLTLTVDCDRRARSARRGLRSGLPTNQFVYLYYTATTPAVHNRISRFTAAGDVAVPGSEVVLLDLNNLSAPRTTTAARSTSGRDGKLYAAVGENANGANSQTLTNSSARCCASTTTARSPPTTRSSAPRPA